MIVRLAYCFALWALVAGVMLAVLNGNRVSDTFRKVFIKSVVVAGLSATLAAVVLTIAVQLF